MDRRTCDHQPRGRGAIRIDLPPNLPELAELSVIFISGCGHEETVVRALEAGVADYIVKPFSAAELTATEYELLRARSVNAGRVMRFGALLRRVWGRREDAGGQAVRNFVKKLRRKLGDDPARPTSIHNMRGVGCSMPKSSEA